MGNSPKEAVILELLLASESEFGLRGRQFARDTRVGESNTFVTSVAKRLVLRLSAAAERYGCPPSQSEGCARGVNDFEIAFDAEVAVSLDGDSG